MLQDGVLLLRETLVNAAPEPDAPLAYALPDHFLQAPKRPTADKEDVLRVYLEEILMRILAPSLRRHRGDRAFQNLKQGLLNALTGDIAGYRGVVGLAGDLVDLVDIDYPRLRLLYVEVGGLYQL